MNMLLNASTSEISLIIVDLGIILLAGLFFGRLAELIKIPAVTGYLVAGLLLGPIFGILQPEQLNSFAIISDIALGFIAFQVGNELWFGKLKQSGIKIVIITVFQAILTTTIIAFALSFFTPLPVALMLGAIGAATAPAPIMMIVKKYRTKGELTDTVLPVVGLDDAVGVIMFGILLSISVGMLSNTGQTLNAWHIIKEPMLEILISSGLGIAVGLLGGLAVKTVDKNGERKQKTLSVVNIIVILSTGAALYFGGSPILTPMIAGVVVTNMINKECFVLEEETIRFFVPPIMIAFFTLAGAQLQFDVILTAGVVGAIYIIGRIIGKMFGAYIGAHISKASKKVKKYLGVTLLPQSGVAIGLSIAAYSAFETLNHEYALIIKNVILASVLFFALIGPVLVKIAFIKAKETREE